MEQNFGPHIEQKWASAARVVYFPTLTLYLLVTLQS